jgi:hypothetical protein
MQMDNGARTGKCDMLNGNNYFSPNTKANIIMKYSYSFVEHFLDTQN